MRAPLRTLIRTLSLHQDRTGQDGTGRDGTGRLTISARKAGMAEIETAGNASG